MKNLLFGIIISCAVIAGAPCQGTLIISVPTLDGFLIVSDRLRHNDDLGYSDDTEKVLRLSPEAAVAVTGDVGFTEGNLSGTNILKKERLIAFELAKSYFSTNAVGEFNGQHFASCMSQQLSNYLASFTLTFDDTDPHCQFIVFRATPAKELRTFVALLAMTRIGPVTTVSASCQEAVQTDRDPAEIGAYGSAELPLQLGRGHDPRFSDVRTNSIIAKFLPNPPRIKKVKLSDAQTFARCLMAEASAKTSLLNTNAMIGTNLQEVILRFK